MSIEDPRLSSIDNTSAANDFDSAVEQHLGFVGEASEGIEVAQAETPDAGRTDRLPAQTPPAQTAAATIPTEVTPNAENVVTLPAGIELDNLEFQVDGDNLILVLADGTEIVVIGGAANIPTFVIGEVELPQVALFAALEGSDINVAAGPDGTFSAQSAPAASRNFQDDPIDAGPEDLALADLLGDTAFGDELRTALILGDEGDTGPTFGDAVSGAVDEDYLKNGNINDSAATGSSSVTGSLNINWGSDDDNAAGNTGLTTSGDRGIAFTQDTLDALILRALTSDNAPLVYGLSENGTVLTAYKNNGEDGFGEPVFVVSVSDAGNGSYAFELLGNLDHPDGSTEDNIVIEFEFTAQDDEGDQASSSFTITVNDDSPVIKVPTGEDGEPLFGVVEEEQREVRGAGNEDTDGELDEDYISKAEQGEKRFSEGPLRGGQFVDETTNVAKGSLGISWGADDEDLDDKADFGTVASLGNRSVSFVIPETNASEGEGGGVVTAARSVSSVPTSGGFPLVYDYSADGKTLTAYRFYGESASTGDADKVSVKMLDNSPVFEVVLDDNGSGSYTFTLFGTLDHKGEGEDTLKLDFQFTATDSDGDVTGPATISVIVIDDVPVLHGCDLVFTVDEDDIKTELSAGTSPNDTARWDDSYTGDPDIGYDDGPAYIQGSLTSLVKPGADGLASFSFVTGAEATAALLELTNLGLSSHGDALRYVFRDGVLTAVAGVGEVERNVFTLTLQSSGSFEFKLFDQLDHDVPGDDQFWFKPDADENFDLQDKLIGADVTSINFGVLIKATDGDEDSISLDGAFSIKIRDDIPEVDVRSTDARLVIDETNGSDNFDDETSASTIASLFSGVGLPGVDPDMATQYAAQSGMVQVRIKEGADDDATVTWALKLSNGNGTYSGLQTTDGRAIYLFIENGLVVGRYDKPNDGDDDIRLPGQSDPDPAAFAIHIGADGTLSMVQYVSIKHDDRGDNDEANDNGTNANDSQDYDLNDSPNPVQQTLEGKIKAVVTVRDYDGDKASDEVEIGGRIVFQDDGPRIDVVATGEGEIVLETQDGETIGFNVTDYATSTANFSNVFSIGSRDYGADGAGNVSALSYELGIYKSNWADSGLRSDGQIVRIVLDGGKVYGVVGANTLVFSIAVSNTGVVTVSQFREIDHTTPDAGGPYTSDLQSLANGLVKLTATATITDGDGDKARDSSTIDLGGNIKFADHGPTVGTGSIAFTVDEDGLPTKALDSGKSGEFAGSGSATASGLAGALTGLFNFGADGAHATQAISLKPTASPVDSGFDSKGGDILIKVVGNTLTGYVVGTPERVVFELKVNADGSYRFELKDQIDHPTLNGQTGDNTENLLAGGIDLSAYIVGKDGDGDTVALTAGKFVVDVRDDIPSINTGSVGIEVQPPQISAPVPGKVANFVLVLDASGSTDLEEIKDQVEDFLRSVGNSGAKDVRVHIVEFSNSAEPVGTFDLIVGGQIQPNAVQAAINAANALQGGGGTNYEAGLQQALVWIEGKPAATLVVDGEDDFDANRLGSGNGNSDDAFILSGGATQIAYVSGWIQKGEVIGHLVDVDGDLGAGWGVEGAGYNDPDDVEANEILRFDFGAFDNFGVSDFVGNGFAGVPVTSARFSLDDNNDSGLTVFNYRIVFTDGQIQTGSQNVSTTGDNVVDLVLAGTNSNAGKQIAYVEFSTTGNGQGDVDLRSVVTAAQLPGTLPNADLNKVIFLSDGEPNRTNSDNNATESQALTAIGGEVTAIETAGNAGALDQKFTIEAFGVGNGPDLANLAVVEGPLGSASALNDNNTLSKALKADLDGLAATPGTLTPSVKTFDIGGLVKVGADDAVAFSLKTDTSGLRSLTSGNTPLTYSVENNVLTAKAGALIVFTLALQADGKGTFTLSAPIDGPGDKVIDISTLVQAQDFDGDAVSLAAGKFLVTIDGSPFGAAQTFETQEDKSFSGNVAATIGDEGLGANGGYDLVIGSGPSNGSLLLNKLTGAFTYTPNTNWYGTETFTVNVKDDDGDASNPIVVTINVTPVNDAPTAVDDSLSSVAEDSGVRLISINSLLGNDSKGPANENGQTLTITGLSNVVGGTAVINGGNIEFTPTANYNGAASFDYTVSDNGQTNGSSDPKEDVGTVSFMVTAVNDAPVARDDSFTISEDTDLVLPISNLSALTGNDSDIDGDTLRVNLLDNSQNGTISVVGGNLVFRPNANFTGEASFRYQVTDDKGGFATAVAKITVTPSNDAPVLSDLGGTLAYSEGQGARAIDADLTVTDVDNATLASATVQITGGYQSGEDVLNFINNNSTKFGNISASYNSGNGQLTLSSAGATATKAQFEAALEAVTYENKSDTPNISNRVVSYAVNDGDKPSNIGQATITVAAVNDAPVITGDKTLALDEGATITVAAADLGFTDPDDTPAGVTFTVTSPTNGTVLVNGVAASSFTGTQLQTGQVSFRHDGSETTSASFGVSLEDGNEDNSTPATATVTVNVTPVPDSPVTRTFTNQGGTVDMTAFDKVVFNNTSISSGHNTVVTVSNFNVAQDKISISVGGTAMTGAFTTATDGDRNGRNDTDIGSSFRIVQLTRTVSTSDFDNDGHEDKIEEEIVDQVREMDFSGSQKSYVFIVYSGTGSNVSAAIYTVLATGQNGINNVSYGQIEVEHVMTITGITYGSLNASHFVAAADPIILDLDKNGFAFSSIDNGVTFDIDADGKGDQIAWTSDDGILAYDVDGNGVIDNGSEIFTPDFNGGKFASGVAALASLDSNGDGMIDASDEAFSKLQVWVDADNDGISDEGELSSLSANGVASISLTTEQTGGEEDGQTVFAEGEFTFADGSTGNFLEVGFDTIFGSQTDGLTLHGGMGEVVMTGSAGADTFVFDGTALDELDVADVITDFSSEEGDVLDVTALLDSLLGEQASVDTAASHLRATVDDGNTTVSVQTAPDTWKDVVVLQNHDTAIKVLFDDKHATITPHD